MMKKESISIPETGVLAEISRFSAEHHDDVHIMLHAPAGGDFSAQLQNILQAEKILVNDSRFSGLSLLMKRYFLSDIVNQAPSLREALTEDNYSIIQQSPLDGSKIAVWLWLESCEERPSDEQLVFQSFAPSKPDSSFNQTNEVLSAYEDMLQQNGCNIAEHCIRTWFFVRDVDTQYKGMVDARREFFMLHGLTDQTHYLASTGIGGLPESTDAILSMDTLSAFGIPASRIQFLCAKSHLNPTYEYGVTFERGTKVSFPSYSQIFISGTASIDNKGDVLYVGDITRQTHRMLENVQMLLQEGGAELSDVAQVIVYLRDIADYAVVREIMKQTFPDTPLVITAAPVCRPAWLIEMECIANV